MVFFKRKEKVIDLSDRYHKQQAQLKSMKEESSVDSNNPNSEQPASIFPFFNSASGSETLNKGSSSNDYVEMSQTDDKKKRLAKRLMDMTEKIEDLSNQIYHLQQRIEVLERKNSSGF